MRSPPNDSWRFFAILVTYQPHLERLHAAVESLAIQLEHIINVDNGSARATRERIIAEFGHCELIGLEKNHGLGYAQNRGIEKAIASGATHLLLADQDTVFPENTIECLSESLNLLSQHGITPGVIGCAYRSHNTSVKEPAIRFGNPENYKHLASETIQIVECDLVIASGSLIHSRTITRAGLMDERLFIDHIDHDWCLKTQSLGFPTFRCESVITQHELGKHKRSFWFLRRMTLDVHPDFRYYYFYRNALILIRRYQKPDWHRFMRSVLVKLTIKLILIEPLNWSRFRLIFKGIYEGLRGITGPLHPFPCHASEERLDQSDDPSN